MTAVKVERRHRDKARWVVCGQDALRIDLCSRWVESADTYGMAQAAVDALDRAAQAIAEAEHSALAAAQGEWWVALDEGETVSLLTEAMRAADQAFERVGGSTRHHVRDCLIPELERMGLAIVRIPPPPTPEASK